MLLRGVGTQLVQRAATHVGVPTVCGGGTVPVPTLRSIPSWFMSVRRSTTRLACSYTLLTFCFPPSLSPRYCRTAPTLSGCPACWSTAVRTCTCSFVACRYGGITAITSHSRPSSFSFSSVSRPCPAFAVGVRRRVCSTTRHGWSSP